MNHEEILLVVEELESRIDVNSYRSDGFQVWPIIRIVLDATLHQNKDTSRTHTWRQPLSQLTVGVKKLLTLFINHVRFFFDNGIDRNCKVLLLSQPSHYTKIRGRSELFDRIIDPFSVSIKGLMSSQKLIMGFLPSKELYINGVFFPLFFRKSSSKVSITDCSDLYIELGKLGLDTDEFRRALYKELAVFHSSRKAAYKLISQMPSLTHLVTSCWYSSLQLGVICACHERELVVINIQHGSQFGHSLFGNWANIPAQGYALLPNIFLCWGETSSHDIDIWASKSNVHRSLIVGYPWKEFRENLLTPIANDLEMDDTFKKRILITLQGAAFATNPELDIEDLADLLLDGDLEVTFRFHPNDHALKSALKPFIKRCNNRRFQFIDSTQDLYSLLEKSTHHITWFSSSCFDALVQNVPTLLLGADSKYVYKKEIEKEIFSWSPRANENVHNFLSHTGNIKDGQFSVLHTSLSKYRLLIGQLFELKLTDL